MKSYTDGSSHLQKQELKGLKVIIAPLNTPKHVDGNLSVLSKRIPEGYQLKLIPLLPCPQFQIWSADPESRVIFGVNERRALLEHPSSCLSYRWEEKSSGTVLNEEVG